MDVKLVNLLNEDPIIYLLQFCKTEFNFNFPLPFFWQFSPPNRRQIEFFENLFAEYVYQLQPSFKNQFGLVPILYSQFQNKYKLEKFLIDNSFSDIEGLKCDKLHYLHLIFALFNPETEELALQKLQFTLLNEIIYEEFPGVPKITDLDEQFVLYEYKIDQQDDKDINESMDFLFNLEIEQILELDTDEQVMNSAIFTHFNTLFTFIAELEDEKIFMLREKFINLLLAQTVVSTINVQFLLSVPQILILLIYNFLSQTFNDKTPVSLTLIYNMANQLQLYLSIFDDNIMIRSGILNCIFGEVRAFANIDRSENKGLSAKQLQWLHGSKIEEKIVKFYQFEETIENVTLALVLEHKMGFKKFTNQIFSQKFYQDIIMQKVQPANQNEIIYYNLLNKLFKAYIPDCKNIEIFNYFQCNYTAPLSSTTNFHRMLRIFDQFTQKEWKIEFKAKSGVLSFANGIINMQKGKNLTSNSTNLFVQMLINYTEGLKSSNICNIVGHILQRLILREMGENNPTILQLLKVLNYNQFCPETLNFDDLMQFSQSVQFNDKNIKMLLFYVNQFVLQSKLTPETITTYQTVLTFLLGQHIQIYNNFELLYNIQYNIENRISFSINSTPKQLKLDIIILQKLIYQEFYFQKTVQQQKIYANMTIFLLKIDPNFILANRGILTRKTCKFDFIGQFSLFVCKNNFQDVFTEFIKQAKQFNVISRFFTSEESLNYILELASQVDMQKVIYNIYNYYIINSNIDENFYSKLRNQLLKISPDNLDESGLDLLISLFRTDNSDFYTTKFQLPHNFCFDLLQVYESNSEGVKNQILIAISQILTRQQLSNELINLVTRISNSLNFTNSGPDRIRLAFLCHVRNVMEGNDERRSQVLPAGLMRSVKEMRERVGVEE